MNKFIERETLRANAACPIGGTEDRRPGVVNLNNKCSHGDMARPSAAQRNRSLYPGDTETRAIRYGSYSNKVRQSLLGLLGPSRVLCIYSKCLSG